MVGEWFPHIYTRRLNLQSLRNLRHQPCLNRSRCFRSSNPRLFLQTAVVGIACTHYGLWSAAFKILDPLFHYVQAVVQELFAAETALNLATGCLWNASRLDEDHCIHLHFVLFCHCLKDVAGHFGYIYIPILTLYLLNNHKPLFIRYIY